MFMHSFDPSVAKSLDSIPKAILLNEIVYHIETNKANEFYEHDGKNWMKCSMKGFVEKFFYMSQATIERSVKAMLDDGIIEKGNFNTWKADKTNWYSLTDKGVELVYHHEFEKKARALPGANLEEEQRKNFELIWDLYPKKKGNKQKAFHAYQGWLTGKKIGARVYKLDNRQIWLAVKRYVNEREKSETEYQYWKNFETLLGESLLDYYREEDRLKETKGT